MTQLYLVFFLLWLNLSVYSQIGINTETPHRSAALDVNAPNNDKGLLLPTMTTSEKNAIANPANSLLVYDTDKNCISQNLGSEIAPAWTCLTLFNRKFLYMPSINIKTTVPGNAQLDLYKIYKDQFSTPMSISAGGPASIPSFAAATDLYYYVTYYDPTLLTINSIDANGVMDYTVLRNANFDAYMNIIFVIR
ncbi:MULTISPECIES: hypothetical protein [unclassified Dysgonomonas]|uniref:hypothetical protein n=1 Tax=unclassified Dysgonomonas TaxID=2630389 RepID=UPI0006828EA2|nr:MULTISPECIES: hypothetical protein [unclassified Dysgonomonas]MBD8347917.1 hypothetical protein [Dysgonomonas sp. HGC4]MBF0575592.1 hypothetical protein [Dysgonomonas sp. GY617]